MIYRKWSLLTGPVVILGGIVGTIIIANFVIFDNDPFGQRKKRNSDANPSTKSRKEDE